MLSVVVALTRRRGSRSPPCFPPTVCDKVPSFPLTGSRGKVRPLHWYCEDTPTSAARLAGSLRSPSNTCAAPCPSLPPVQDALPEGLGLSGSATPVPTHGHAGDGRPPRFLGNPRDGSPGSWTPVGPARQAVRRADAAPACGNSKGSRQENFRGSMSRLSVWLSTLRRVGRPTTTQDSLPAAGQLYRAGFGPAGFRRKVSDLYRYISSPFSRLALAQ